jgi:hypothetical protein
MQRICKEGALLRNCAGGCGYDTVRGARAGTPPGAARCAQREGAALRPGDVRGPRTTGTEAPQMGSDARR